VPASLTVLQALQHQRVIDYNHSLVKQAVQLLQQTWGPGLVLGINKDGTTAGMAAVEMPWPLAIPTSSSSSNVVGKAADPAADGSSSSRSDNAPAAAAVNVAVNGIAAAANAPAAGGPSWDAASAAPALAINKYLREVHCIEVPVACVEGRMFVRISAQIYNNIADYQALADAVLGLAAAAAPKQ
jgi:hypothetical protein